MKVLILGATGMLGYSLYKNIGKYSEFEVHGTVRSLQGKENFFSDTQENIIQNIDVTDLTALEGTISDILPDVVINCIGLIKQHSISKQHISAIKINSLLPHQLAALCDQHDCKLVHFSTDCVFDGSVGNYLEEDLPTATDLYGRSKLLGEVVYGEHLTLRTSIIGHELSSDASLVDWFLSQKDTVSGFSKAFFSGLPTAYIAKLLAENILVNNKLTGLYNLSVNPINKFKLLTLIKEIYNMDIQLLENSDFVIDRSLNSEKLQDAAQIHVPAWRELVEFMHQDYELLYKSARV